jgi:hypothetical protein
MLFFSAGYIGYYAGRLNRIAPPNTTAALHRPKAPLTSKRRMQTLAVSRVWWLLLFDTGFEESAGS